MNKPYRYRVNGLHDPSSLTTVWAFEQESKPGYVVRWTNTLEDGSLRVETSCRVKAINKAQEISDWGVPESEMVVETIERKPKRLLRDTSQGHQAAFVGCRQKRNPIYILGPNGLVLGPKSWTRKCGAERGEDSGQYFVCPDCALLYGYRW